MIVQDLNQRGATKFSAVRFGNVLGSRGSVVPIFRKQIKNRGPVTVRKKDTKRYFMMASEAALLVLQAGAISEKGGEVFVLDMGKPVKIIDLAKEMIRLSGFEPDEDIPITITELVNGEKIFENILTAEEGTEATKHEKIFITKMREGLDGEELESYLMKLKELANRGANHEIKSLLAEIFSYSQICK